MRDGVSSTVALGSHATASGPTDTICPLTRTNRPDDHGGTPRPYCPFTPTAAVEPASERYLPSTPSLIPRTFTPQLPPELWLLILSYASTAAGDFTTEHGIYPSEDPVLYPSFLHRHPNAELLASYSHRVKFRSHLTRVCRLWNQIGQEMLWSEVWIAGSRDGRRVRWRLEGLAYVPGIRERAMDERARINAMTMEDKFTESNPKTKAKWWNIGWGKKKTTSYGLNAKTTTSKPSPTSSSTLTHTHISQQSPPFFAVTEMQDLISATCVLKQDFGTNARQRTCWLSLDCPQGWRFLRTLMEPAAIGAAWLCHLFRI